MKRPKNRFPFFMKATAVGSGILTALLFGGQAALGWNWASPIAITMLTVFYHFAMRLCVGALVPNCFRRDTAWFRLRPWEEELYRKLKLRKWKKRVPTYDPRAFSLREHTPEQIIANMRHAEVVHEVIVVLSFLPLLFSLAFGSFFVFLITSVLSAALDCVFVCLQRYNRPRMQRLLMKTK